MKRIRERLVRAWPPALMLASALLFFRHVLFTNRYFIPWDLPGYHLPLAAYFARSLREGRFPLWDPFTYCGYPFYANLQAQVFYPPMWLAALAGNYLGPRKLANILEWEVALHVWAAGAFAYLLARRLGLGRRASIFGGIIFQMGGYFASQAQHLGAVSSAAWMPLAWCGAIELGRMRSWRWVALSAIALAMSVLGGFPSTFLVVWGTFFMLALMLVLMRYAAPRSLLHVALAMLLGLLLAAPQLLPSLELTGYSAARERAAWQTENGLPWQSFVSLLIPDYYHVHDLSQYTLRWNFTFVYLYCGLAGLVLALVALAASRHRYRLVLATLLVCSALWMLGDYTPAWHWGKWLLPGNVRGADYPEFAMCAFILSLALLAALGFEQWMGRRTLVATLVIAGSVADLVYHSSGRPMNAAPAADLRRISEIEFEDSRKIPERLHQLTAEKFPPLRIETIDDSVTWPYNLPMLGLYSPTGNDPLALARLLHVRGLFATGPEWQRNAQVDHPGSPLLDLVNVGYIVSYTQSKSPLLHPPDLEPSEADVDAHSIWRNPGAMPRFFVVPQTRAANNGERALGFLSAASFDPRATGIVEGIRGHGYGTGTVRVLEYQPEHFKLEMEGTAPMFLVTSEAWYPGWRAFVDGAEQPVILTNVAFRGLEVPAGKHAIEFRFQPEILWWAVGVGLLGWLLATAILPARPFPLFRRGRE